jgi:steroid 5-alpha reductase family enzyme
MTLAATIVAGPSSALAYGAAGVAVLMLVLWAISIRIRDVSIIDRTCAGARAAAP